MGYEIMRFTHELDEVFHCSLCTMILKEQMQSPSEHLFCKKCIEEWLAIDGTCPIERVPLQLENLKPASRAIRVLVNKFEIKCDFEPEGCAAIVKLENLQDHVGECAYNLKAIVVCDKGCNIEMRRHEYKTNNCFRHLADQAQKLNDEVGSLRK